MDKQVSLVIRTRNEAKHIDRLLTCIQQQSFRDWETIIVDSGSTDATLEIAERYPARIFQIPADQFTFGRSLNVGCHHAVGRYLVFASAHTYPLTNSWLGNLIRPFDDPSTGMVYGRQRGVEVTSVPEERDLERQFGTKSKVLIDEAFGNNANSAIRRGLWEQYPFDESITGLEDVDWARKIQSAGYRVHYAADAAICHIHDETLTQVYRRFFRECVAYRWIFPATRFGVMELAKGLAYNVPADFLFALRRRRPVGKIARAPLVRLAEAAGRWHGFNCHRKLGPDLLMKLYYPKESQSVVIRDAGQHGFQKIDVPPVGVNEVLIQVAYVGVCATDLEVAEGSLTYYRQGYAKYPIVPGHEYSGVVVGVGSGVTDFRKGDKIVGECAIGCDACAACTAGGYYRCETRREVGVINMDGAYGQFLKIPSQYVHKLPRQVMLREAALIEPMAVCLKGLRKLAVPRSAKTCIIGAGSLGNICAQILKSAGVEVTVIDRDVRRLRLVEKYDISVHKEVNSLDQFDYLVDATGDEKVIPSLIEQSKPSAKILLLGLPYSNSVSVCFSSIPCYDKQIIGSIASERRDWKEAIRLIQSGGINLEDHTSTVLPLESYERAWKSVQERERFKVILVCSPALAGY